MSRKAPTEHTRKRKPTAKLINAYLAAAAARFDCSQRAMLSDRSKGGGGPNGTPTHRHVAIYLLRHDLGMHLDDLARRFQRTRTTIIRTLAHVERKLENGGRKHREAIEAVRQDLRADGIIHLCDRCNGYVPAGMDHTFHEGSANGEARNGGESSEAVLTNSNTQTIFRKGRRVSATRTSDRHGDGRNAPGKVKPPGLKAKPLTRRPETGGGKRLA